MIGAALEPRRAPAPLRSHVVTTQRPNGERGTHTMLVRMKRKIGGYRNLEEWPDAGHTIDVPADEAASLIANGYADAADTAPADTGADEGTDDDADAAENSDSDPAADGDQAEWFDGDAQAAEDSGEVTEATTRRRRRPASA